MVSLYEEEIDKIYQHLVQDLKNADKSNDKTKYTIYRSAFDEVINLCKVYRPLLLKIKDEYESLINHVESAQRFSRIIQEDIEVATSFPTTYENYTRHCKSLRLKLMQLREQNDDKMNKIRVIKMKSDAVRKAIELERGENEELNEKRGKFFIRRDIRRLPQMKLYQLTDLETMQSKCKELEIEKQQILHSKHTKYVKNAQEKELTRKLTDSVNEEHETRNEVTLLIRKKVLLQAALQRSREFQKTSVINQNLGEVIIRSLIEANGLIKDKDLDEEEIETFFPDPNSDSSFALKESEYIVMCIQKFEKLFTDLKFSEAADLAVIVPRGVLRTYAVLLKYKDVGDCHALYYIQNLLNTEKDGIKINKEMSYICVDVALKEGRLDLINVWISKKKLMCTDEIAECLVSYADLMRDSSNKTNCLDLAIQIYKERLETTNDDQIKHRLIDTILECNVKANYIEEAFEILSNNDRYKDSDINQLISCYPTMKLIAKILENNLSSFENILSEFIEIKSNLGIFADLLMYYVNLHNGDISPLIEILIKIAPNGIDSCIWEELLNFVGEKQEKSILEIASSYMVQLSLDRSYEYLCQNGWL